MNFGQIFTYYCIISGQLSPHISSPYKSHFIDVDYSKGAYMALCDKQSKSIFWQFFSCSYFLEGATRGENILIAQTMQ